MNKDTNKTNNYTTKEDLVINNLQLAKWIAEKMNNVKSFSFDDIYSFACEGLVIASNTFQEDKGFKFSTYATKVMKNVILNRIFEDKWIYNGRWKKEFNNFIYADTPLSEEEGTSLLDMIQDDNNYYEELENNMLLEKGFEFVTIEERQLIVGKYIEGYKCKEMAKFFNDTEKNVSARIRKGLIKIRKGLNN